MVKTSVPGMELLPSNIDLSGAEVQLVHEVGREFVLGGVLEPLLPDYDIVLIDCQPSLGLLTVNALACADGIIVPLECEYFAMRGVALLTETIDKVSRRINPRLRMDGLLATMYDSRTLHSREVLTRVVDRVRRPGVPHRDQPHRAVPGRHRGRRADHLFRPSLHRCQFLPGTRQGGAGAVAAGSPRLSRGRRVSLPGVHELLRPAIRDQLRPRRAPGQRA